MQIHRTPFFQFSHISLNWISVFFSSLLLKQFVSVKAFNSIIAQTKVAWALCSYGGLISMWVIFYLLSGCGLRSLGSYCKCLQCACWQAGVERRRAKKMALEMLVMWERVRRSEQRKSKVILRGSKYRTRKGLKWFLSACKVFFFLFYLLLSLHFLPHIQVRSWYRVRGEIFRSILLTNLHVIFKVI